MSTSDVSIKLKNMLMELENLTIENMLVNLKFSPVEALDLLYGIHWYYNLGSIYVTNILSDIRFYNSKLEDAIDRNDKFEEKLYTIMLDLTKVMFNYQAEK
jgi:hypothetical protein